MTPPPTVNTTKDASDHAVLWAESVSIVVRSLTPVLFALLEVVVLIFVKGDSKYPTATALVSAGTGMYQQGRKQ